jgi:peroxiredoxin
MSYNGAAAGSRRVLHAEEASVTTNAGVQVGQVAPEFRLMANTREEISLSQYNGLKKVVLAFYPLDFTGG